MPQESLRIEDVVGSKAGPRILRLTGPIVINNLFEFQAMVRADTSRALIIDLSNVPYVDSAGIGALVGAYVTHQKDGRSLALVGVSDRILVMHEGQISGELGRDQFSEHNVMQLAVGKAMNSDQPC